ncbi:MAG: 5'/3'-nucleotidase SurE [Flavobacteriales bacterium]|nr:5'/3'-nucleotidase SurE [Flavobacteriales bacterium]
MEKKPLILVTNDDGITAPGIKNLVESVKDFGELIIVAPDKPQSAMGHAITVNVPLYLNETDYFENHRAYSASGTPVDCVKLAMHILGDRKPDLVVSGINHGSNASTNVLYSGTMSAAVEGALDGIPSIGFSLLDFSHEADMSASRVIVQRVVKSALEHGIPKDTCLNVNIPKLPIEEIKGIRISRQARAFWDDGFEERTTPFGRKYYWLTGQFTNYDGGEDTDMWALNNGYVSIVPTQFDMTSHHSIADLNTWKI